MSFWRQHASRKSVTGDNSANRGRPASFKFVNICKIQYGGGSWGLTGVPAMVHRLHCDRCFFLVVVTRVYVPNEVVSYIVADVHLEQVSVFHQFTVNVLVYHPIARQLILTNHEPAQDEERDSQNPSKYSFSSASLKAPFGLASGAGAPAGLKCGLLVVPGAWEGFWYMLEMTRVWENWGLMCLREQRSPCRQAPILR